MVAPRDSYRLKILGLEAKASKYPQIYPQKTPLFLANYRDILLVYKDDFTIALIEPWKRACVI